MSYAKSKRRKGKTYVIDIIFRDKRDSMLTLIRLVNGQRVC